MGHVVELVLDMESSKEIESSSSPNRSKIEYLGIRLLMRKSVKFPLDRSASTSNLQAPRDSRINPEFTASQERQQEPVGPSNQEDAQNEQNV